MKVTPPTSYVRSSSVIRGEEALAGVFHGAYEKSGFALSAPDAPQGEKQRHCENTSPTKARTKQPDELAPEYRFEYGNAKPNRFAKRLRPESIAVLLDPDVAQVFETGGGGECRAPGVDDDNASGSSLIPPMNHISGISCDAPVVYRKLLSDAEGRVLLRSDDAARNTRPTIPGSIPPPAAPAECLPNLSTAAPACPSAQPSFDPNRPAPFRPSR